MNIFFILAVIAIIAFVYMQRESFNNASASAVAASQNCTRKLYNLTNGVGYICGKNTNSVNINNKEVTLGNDVKSVHIIPTRFSIKAGLTQIESNVLVTPFSLPQNPVIRVYYNNTQAVMNVSNGFSVNEMCNIYTSKTL